MRATRFLQVGLFSLLTLGAVASAHAVSLSITISGNVGAVPAELSSIFTTGDPVTGTIVYNISDQHFGPVYFPDDPITRFGFGQAIYGQSLPTDPIFTSFELTVSGLTYNAATPNDFLALCDRDATCLYDVPGEPDTDDFMRWIAFEPTGPSIGGALFADMDVLFIGDGLLTEGVTLPDVTTVQSYVSNSTSVLGSFTFTEAIPDFFPDPYTGPVPVQIPFSASVVSLQVIPEPAPMSYLGIVLLGMLGARLVKGNRIAGAH